MAVLEWVGKIRQSQKAKLDTFKPSFMILEAFPSPFPWYYWMDAAYLENGHAYTAV